MSDNVTAIKGAIGTIATLALDQVNTSIASMVGVCSLIIVLPKTIRTLSIYGHRFCHWLRFYNKK